MQDAIIEHQNIDAMEEIQDEVKEIVLKERSWGIVPKSFVDFMELSTVISKSGLAPKGMQTQEQIFCALQMGAEIGLTPMQSVQSIAVINGRPTVWGDAALGLVQASGLLTAFHETPIIEDGKFLGYHCQASRQGMPGLTEHIFTMDDAKTAGLLGKQSPWKTMPKRMCQMRARGFVLRDLFADRLKGIYLSEEIQGGENFIDVTPANDRPTIQMPQPIQQAEPVSASEESPSETGQEPRQEPSADNPAVGIVSKVAQNKTKGNDRYGIEINEIWYNTFSKTFKELADDSKQHQKPVSIEWKEVEWEPGSFSKNVVTMTEFGG